MTRAYKAARAIAEQALGHALPAEAIVHHGDGNSENNEHDNLVICPDQAYHLLLHIRMRALAACGNADWRACEICKKYDKLEDLREEIKQNGQPKYYHGACSTKYQSLRKRARWEAWKAVNGSST